MAHDRMPAILARDYYAKWLGEVVAGSEELHAMLKPCAVPIELLRVSPRVNQSKVDSPDVFEVMV